PPAIIGAARLVASAAVGSATEAIAGAAPAAPAAPAPSPAAVPAAAVPMPASASRLSKAPPTVTKLIEFLVCRRYKLLLYLVEFLLAALFRKVYGHPEGILNDPAGPFDASLRDKDTWRLVIPWSFFSRDGDLALQDYA